MRIDCAAETGCNCMLTKVLKKKVLAGQHLTFSIHLGMGAM
jgi:hypothetical protein